jgi:hypothetical protein
VNARTLAAVACACLAAFGGAARADDPPPQDAARARFDHGQKLYNLGKFRDAIADFEAAYELDPDPVYLFNLAQAHRLDNNIDRALFFYRRYLDLQPDAANREEVEGRIKALEVERDAKAAADKAAADKAAADKAAADAAAANHPVETPKRVRIGIDVGWSIVYLVGLDKHVAPQLTERLLIAYMKHFGRLTLDLGASFQLTTIPYENPTNGSVSASYTQLHAVVAATYPIAGPIWGRLGVGLGTSMFGNLQEGNPLIMDGSEAGDQRMLCARVDAIVGYRVNPVIDFVLDVVSTSISTTNKRLDPQLTKTVALEGFYLGVYLKL